MHSSLHLPGLEGSTYLWDLDAVSKRKKSRPAYLDKPVRSVRTEHKSPEEVSLALKKAWKKRKAREAKAKKQAKRK